MSRSIPSLKTLTAGFGRYHDVTPAKLKELHKALERWRDRDGTSWFEVLNLADELLSTHGVESLTSVNERAEAHYCNTGDSYASTLLFDRAAYSFRVTCWADYVERQERRGNRFA